MSASWFKSAAIAAFAFGLAAPAAQAATCVGACGVRSADGVVAAPPNSDSYRWISTWGGQQGAGQIDSVGGTNGSMFTTSIFDADAGDNLEFYFNYVTSDGQQSDGFIYEDYTWVELQDDAGDHVAFIFTARTEPQGTIVPGVGLPGVEATLTPGSVPIIPGAPNWSRLGDYNNTCWGPGCGYTGWIRSDFTIQDSGSYQLVFGVTNWGDEVFDSGLAFDGLQVGGRYVDDDENEPHDDDDHPGAVPEPATWALMLLGFGGAGQMLRRRRRSAAARA